MAYKTNNQLLAELLPDFKLEKVSIVQKDGVAKITVDISLTEESSMGEEINIWDSPYGSQFLKYTFLEVAQIYGGRISNERKTLQLSSFYEENFVEEELLPSNRYAKTYWYTAEFRLDATLEKDLAYRIQTFISLDKIAQEVGFSVDSAGRPPFKETTYPIYTDGEFVESEAVIQAYIDYEEVQKQAFDFSSLNYSNEFKQFMPSQMPKYPSNVSRLFLSTDKTGSGKLFFTVDIKTALLNSSLYTSLLDSSEGVLEDVLGYTQIRSMRLLRQRVKSNGELFDSNQSYTLLANISDNANVYDEDEASLKEINVTLREPVAGLRFYEAVDKEIANFTLGKYQYSIELEIEDGAVALLLALKERLWGYKQALEEYFRLGSSPAFYDRKRNGFKKGLVFSLTDDIRAVLVRAPKEYAKALKLLTDITDRKAFQIQELLSKYISFKSGSPEAAKNFIQLLEGVIAELEKADSFTRFTYVHKFSDLFDSDFPKEAGITYLTKDVIEHTGHRRMTRNEADDTFENGLVAPIEINERTIKAIESVHEVLSDASFHLVQPTYEEKSKMTANPELWHKGIDAQKDPVNVPETFRKAVNKAAGASLDKAAMQKSVQVLTGFGRGNFGTILRKELWTKQSRELFDSLSGTVLCRLLNESTEPYPIYDAHFFVELGEKNE